MIIKTINLENYKEVTELIRESFSQSEHGYGNEAELVDKIRNEEGYIKDLEIVAFEDGKIVGHGLLSEVEIVSDSQKFKGLVLAPLDVLTTYQGKGIGAAVLLELEKRAKSNFSALCLSSEKDAAPFYQKQNYVFVSNHPNYNYFKYLI